MHMVFNILALYPILVPSLMDMFSMCQVFHQTTLQKFSTIEAIRYVVFLLNVGIYFSSLYLIYDFLLSI